MSVERHDERIDAALDLLKQARPPEGMAERVAAAVRVRQAERAASGLGSGLGWVWGGVAAVVAIVALLAGVGVYRAGRERTDSARRADAVKPLAPAIPREFVTKADQPSAESHVRPAAKVSVRKAAPVRGGDSVAAREARAVSYPAPPMPLTEQERLLLRVAHKGDPEELAMLNPVVRAARDAADKAEVEKFFGVSPNEATNRGQ